MGPVDHRLAIVAAVFIVWLIPPGVEAGSETAGYVALPQGAGAVSCPADSHTLLDGPGHSPPGPSPVEDPVGWLASYEHECTANDGQNAAREVLGQERSGFGYGAYGFVFGETDQGTPAIAVAEDAVFGSMPHLLMYVQTLDGTDASEEGCGPQAMVLPEDAAPHWLWEDLRLWVWVHPIHVEDDLEPCFGSTGQLHATWGT